MGFILESKLLRRWTPGWRTLASSEHSEHGLQQER